MSTIEITAYHLQCDVEDCDEVSDPQITEADADESASAAGWHLDEREGRDKCPRHAAEYPW
jgi:hypothetical protein